MNYDPHRILDLDERDEMEQYWPSDMDGYQTEFHTTGKMKVSDECYCYQL